MGGVTDPFDPATLALPEGVAPTRKSKRPPRHRRGEMFLKGPIPWQWLRQASRLPGEALWVGLSAWREAGCRKARVVPLNLSRLGVPRRTAQRALQTLQQAGLVAVEHRHGRPALVTLQDAPSQSTPGSDVIPAQT